MSKKKAESPPSKRAEKLAKKLWGRSHASEARVQEMIVLLNELAAFVEEKRK